MSNDTTVRVWAEEVAIPTYLAGSPNRNPMFLEKRVYQGSSGRVYPYPVIDKISDEKVPESHPAIFLENEYLKLMVLPGFGGRIQYAYDKTNNYPFIYHNRVIKPALVGLAGPWLSGGIEFNWPQHHRPGTYCPVNHTITRNADGSMTLWLSEIEPMWHLKGTLGLTLYPGKALLEINLRLFNPTRLPQSFHLWTNPAVHVNDRYQSVFPPDVQAVYDHGKRDVSSFPIARGEYYKVDYSRGVDISWYKNLPVPTSYMAAKSAYDFVGGYDHGRQAGVLHVADHHVVPGKKQWVWGCGDFGRAWDRNLTDEDGPYAELMCGVFADNQPDFSWLQPFEEKEVRQYFLPYKAIGYVRNATINAAASLEVADGKARLGVYASSPRPGAIIRLARRQTVIWQTAHDLGPTQPFSTEARLPTGSLPEEIELSVWSRQGQQLVAYRLEPKQPAAIPQPARPILPPACLESNEALYLAGLHLEQYRHATREPEDYYREALRRDPSDLRTNNALGLLWLRRGQFARAEPLFRAAIQTQTRHNPNPLDGEPYFNLGVCLRYLGRSAEAFDAFYKATWNAAWQDSAFLQLAQLSMARGDLEPALELVERSLARNSRNQKAAHLKTMLLRKVGRSTEALQTAKQALERDPLDAGALNEMSLLRQAGTVASRHSKAGVVLSQPKRGYARAHVGAFAAISQPNHHASLEIAADYAHAGNYADAIRLLEQAAASVASVSSVVERPTQRSLKRAGDKTAHGRAPGHVGEPGMPSAIPMLFYFLGYYARQDGDDSRAAKYFKLAAAQNPDRCFPNSLDSILVLRAALDFNPHDAHAALYFGNLWYDKRQVPEATACWELARLADPSLPTVHRNLALVYFNKEHAARKALKFLRRAFALDPSDARVLFELDLLKKRLGIAPEDRFAFLRKHRAAVDEREDLFLEFVTLLNILGRHDEALQALLSRTFHPWEGGEGKATGQYVLGLVEQAKALLKVRAGIATVSASRRSEASLPRQNKASRVSADAREAVALLERAQHYPETLAEGKLHGARENAIHFWLGVALEQVGDRKSARDAWQKASIGMKVPTPAVYYNDQNPETIFYQGLALQKLSRRKAANERFRTLVDFGRKHLNDHVEIDYFAVSLPEFLVFDDDLDRKNQINCRYLMGLGQLGFGKMAEARRQLRKVLSLDPSHQGARLHLNA